MFQPGVSGNPNGRPKGSKELLDVRKLAKTHTKEALAVLREIARDGKKDADRVAAAIAILDRGWGRPAQAMDIEIFQRNIRTWSLEDARLALQLLDQAETDETKTIEGTVNATTGSAEEPLP